MTNASELPGRVSVGGMEAARVGLGTARLRTTGMWGEPGRRAAAVRTIQRAVELGVQLIELAAPFGPWADLLRDADPEPERVVLVVRLTGDAGPAAALEVANRRLGRRLAGRVGAVLVKPGLLDEARSAGIDGVGALVSAATSPSALGSLVAVRGPYPPARRTLEWYEARQVPYLCPDSRILGAGRHTVALLEPTGRADIDRLWEAAGGATPPAAGPG